tara:strand:- start:145 stop:1137 length:993 start_codon:yes stop_codon:yes gene_type:complete
MINIHGPTYKFKGEVLDKPEIIVVRDHQYDEEEQCFHVKKLLDNSSCDPHLHTLIFDHIHDDALREFNCVHLPIFLAAEAREFINENIEIDWDNKSHVFNFSLNKPRIHRELLLKEIERLNLTSFAHSLPWKHNDINSIPITDYKFGSEVIMDKGIKNGSFNNSETYNKLLKTNVYEPSCISIITEPVFYERQAFVTEKSYMAIFGGTIPIWFGGWKIPETMRYLGFDVFDDIVDHSYETLEDPYNRCIQALERNINLFNDIEYLKDLLLKNRDRLLHNVELIKTNVCLEECLHQVEVQPEPIKTELLSLLFHAGVHDLKRRGTLQKVSI